MGAHRVQSNTNFSPHVFVYSCLFVDGSSLLGRGRARMNAEGGVGRLQRIVKGTNGEARNSFYSSFDVVVGCWNVYRE